jgi:DNA-binding MarR family transcriptional regulator
MSFPDDNQRLESACRLIATGRNIARQLAAAVREFQLSETEFRLLWLLRERSSDSDDASTEQSTLAQHLGISPAQVSAIVEKLRTRQMVVSAADANDRRRQVWKLTSSGCKRFESICVTVRLISRGWILPEPTDVRLRSQREDAA